jgi:peptidoglycan-N-acetylglucosamine deacetylase
MESFVLLFSVNLLAGLLPDLPSPKEGVGRRGLYSLVPAFLLGMLSVLAMGRFFQTQVAVLIGYSGLMAGTLVSPFSRRSKTPLLLGRSYGVLTVFMPQTAVVMFLFFLVGSWISNNRTVSLVWAFLLLPFLTAALYKHDIYVLLAGLMAGVMISTLIPQLEEATQRKPNSLVRKRLLFFKVTALCLVVLFLTGLYMTKYVYRGFGMQMDIIRQGNPELNLVALTFDDGPDPLYTPRILDILEECQVPATFFMVGRNVELYPAIAQRIVQEGHAIGNHTYTHRSLVPLSEAATKLQIMLADRVIENVTGEKPVLFRPPRGVYSNYTRELLKNERYTMVLWNITSKDWTETSARNIATNVVNNTQPGSIILLHDSGDIFTSNGGNRENTIKALPLIISGLQEKGYVFVNMHDMIIATGLTHVFEDKE